MNNTISHIILLEQAAGAGAIPQAFLCCSLRQQRVRIYCLHLPSKYIGALDGRITPWDGKVFAFVGDVSHNTATTVQLPDNAFRAFINVRVKTTDYMVTHLDELTDMGFPVVQGNDPESEVISTRQMMYLPARYVPLLLDSAGYSIRDVWEILYPALVNDGNLASCATLVKWLRVASTRTQAGQAAQLSEEAHSEQYMLHREQWRLQSEQYRVHSEQWKLDREQYRLHSEQWRLDSEQYRLHPPWISSQRTSIPLAG